MAGGTQKQSSSTGGYPGRPGLAGIRSRDLLHVYMFTGQNSARHGLSFCLTGVVGGGGGRGGGGRFQPWTSAPAQASLLPQLWAHDWMWTLFSRDLPDGARISIFVFGLRAEIVSGWHENGSLKKRPPFHDSVILGSAHVSIPFGLWAF